MKNYFSDSELSCKCCGKQLFSVSTLRKLNNIRHDAGFPVILNSAYRCKEYNKKIGATQTHATGQAVDIRTSHKKAVILLGLAIKHGMTGFGISQKGKVRFLHLDDLEEAEGRPRPHIWSY